MFCRSVKEGMGKQEPVINTNMQLKSDLDENRKFKY